MRAGQGSDGLLIIAADVEADGLAAWTDRRREKLYDTTISTAPSPDYQVG